jgi:uncharacterized protein (TIGR02466 family)
MAGEPQQQINFLFPTVIRTAKLEDPAAFNARLMQAITDLRARVPGEPPDSWSCSLYTTFNTANQLHREPGFEEFAAHVQSEVDAFARDLGFDLGNKPLELGSCWVNIYGPGHSQEVHVHANCLISGVYYVKAPEGVPGLMIHSPFGDEMLAPKVTPNLANMLFAEVPVSEGQMILFRSWTRHSVRPNTVPGERVSLAFNFK